MKTWNHPKVIRTKNNQELLLGTMKDFKYLITFSISIFGILTITPSTHAAYTCKTDNRGETICIGIINGHQITTTSRTDDRGNTTTIGTVGGDFFSETCRTNDRGETICI